MSDRTLLHHHLRHIAFVHRPYDPAVVQRLLPDGLTVELLDDRAWVSLIAFDVRMRPAGLPPVPWLTRFPQTYLRTYVTGPDGRAGVWFLSLDGARLVPALLARWAWGAPFAWSRVQVARDGDRLSYDVSRRFPADRAHGRLVVEAGARLVADDHDRFLTERSLLWGLSPRGRTRTRRLVATLADHDPWRLRAARLVDADDGLFAAAGLPPTTDTPRLHVVDEMHVRFRGRLPVNVTESTVGTVHLPG